MAEEIISLATMLTGVGGGVLIPFVNKLLGPSADELGVTIAEHARIYRLKNAFNLFRKASEMAAKAGFEPKQVSVKTLLPLLEGASLEDNLELSDKWAALLTNAADPSDKADIKPAYADILRQLTPQEAKVLDELFVEADSMNPFADEQEIREKTYATNAVRKARAVSHLLDLSHMRYNYAGDSTGRQNRDDLQAFDSMIDNMLRQRLLVSAKSKPLKESPFGSDYEPDKNKVFFSSLGFDFILACMPPQEKKSV